MESAFPIWRLDDWWVGTLDMADSPRSVGQGSASHRPCFHLNPYFHSKGLGSDRSQHRTAALRLATGNTLVLEAAGQFYSHGTLSSERVRGVAAEANGMWSCVGSSSSSGKLSHRGVLTQGLPGHHQGRQSQPVPCNSAPGQPTTATN